MIHQTGTAGLATGDRRTSTGSGGWPAHLALMISAVAVCAGVIISRRPDAFTNPQFYAEDGARWFSDAYNDGPWQALFLSYQGHFLVQPRLVALIATPFGAASAPRIYNIFGLIFQILPVAFFLSPRFRSVLPSLWARTALCAVYLLMPSTELNVDVASAQFHLVILATLVLVAPPPTGWGWRLFDAATMTLTALTGAFVYVLLPVALLWWWLRRQRHTAVLCLILLLGLGAQLYSTTVAPRTSSSLGASFSNLMLILCDRVILAGLFAEEGHTHVFVAGHTHAVLWAALFCVASLPVVLYAALRAPWELRFFDLTALGITAAGLAFPLVSTGGDQWAIIVSGQAAERYFLMAQVAWVITLLWAASRLPRPPLRVAGWGLTAAAFVSGLVVAWQYPAFTDDHWPQEAAEIASSPPGAHLTLPIPPFPPWSVDVTVR
ncbi:MAG TPA: hypothetical protein VEK76_08725 [Candidatus Binatia bacterium]|nr:hypothetical protein [Candidatus Binatia bacterium]